MSAEAVWILAERLSREHIAQIYSSDAGLVESIHMFTAHGLSGGEAVILAGISRVRSCRRLLRIQNQA